MTDVAAQPSEFAAALAGLRGYIESHGDGDTAVMGSLDALIAERDNLDDNLARVQRHLQHAVAESKRERARADRLEAAVRWALGETDFGLTMPIPCSDRYWWRKELRERAALSAGSGGRETTP